MDLEAEAYRALFDSNPRPMFVSDRETRQLVLVNAAFERLYGWTRDEAMRMTLVDLRPPEERAMFEASFAATKESPRYARLGRHWKKSGEIMDVHLEIVQTTWCGRAASLAVVTNVTDTAEVERRFRLLVEHSADGISLTNPSGHIEYISPGGEKILGYAANEILGGKASVRVHPDDVATWVAPPMGETRMHLARVQHRDGTWRWIESAVTNLTHDPAVRALVANYRDITFRKAAERAMLDSQRRLEYLLSATSAITYSARAEGDFGATFISASVQDILGHAPQDFMADPGFWLRNIHPDDRGAVDDGLRGLFEHGLHALQYRFRHADGTYRWMRDVARLMRDETGKAVEVVGYWIDVTEQHRAEDLLRRSERDFRVIIERSPAAILVHRQGRIIYANQAFVALFGYEAASEITGKHVLEMTHADEREHIQSRMRATVESGGTVPEEARMLRRDGSVFVFEAQGILLDFDGAPANVVVGRDVTERRELFARMAMAERMLTVGALAAGVAHEINNPLSYVATNLELLARELPLVPVRPDLLGMVADAREGVTRVSAIVRELRALARPEDETRGPVDVAAVIASSIKMAHNEIRHRARVVVECERDLPLVHAHASRLGQVFLNLLINAAQAIDEGRADRNEIRVRATRASTGAHVSIQIEDTGAGIPAPIMRRIFDPFFTTKATGSSMGLGLSISHQIVRGMDGEITVESRPGFGSTFTVRLPAALDGKPERTAAEPALRMRGVRLLLIDDEEAVGRSLEALLAPDVEVVAVTRARDALDRLGAGERFDVVLCDLMMPESSGIDLYEQIAPPYQQRVIFMTGGAFTQQARQFLAHVDRPRLDKPFSEAQLRDAIAGVLDRA